MEEFNSVNAYVAEIEEQVTAFNGGVAVGATTRDTRCVMGRIYRPNHPKPSTLSLLGRQIPSVEGIGSGDTSLDPSCRES